VQIYDLRHNKAVATILGPNISGEAIDVAHDHILLTGSYVSEESIQTWDLRTRHVIKTLSWGGGYITPMFELSEHERNVVRDKNGTLGEDSKDTDAFLYSARFSRQGDLILAGGAGKNEVRVFDYTTGDKVCTIGNLQKPVLTLEVGNKEDKFAWGSADACIRIMNIES